MFLNDKISILTKKTEQAGKKQGVPGVGNDDALDAWRHVHSSSLLVRDGLLSPIASKAQAHLAGTAHEIKAQLKDALAEPAGVAYELIKRDLPQWVKDNQGNAVPMERSLMDLYNNEVGRQYGERAKQEKWSDERLEQELQSAYKRGEFITNPNAPVVMDKDGQVTQPIETTPQTKDGRTRQEEKGSYENYPDSGQASPKKQLSILDGVPQVQKQEDNALREKLEKSARMADTLAAEAVPDRGGQHDAQTRGAMAQVMRRAMMELSVGNEETQKASGLYNEFVTDNLVRPRGNTENDAVFDNMMSQVRKRMESNNASQQNEDVGDIIKQEVGNFFSKFRFGR